MAESKNPNPRAESWQSYLTASIAGALTLVQFGCFFFFGNDKGFASLRILGWIVWLISVVFGILPILTFRSKGGIPQGNSYVKTTVLVDSGLYSIVRHPQYLAGILLNLALMLLSQHWLIILLGFPAMVLMYIDIQKADQHEIEKFGDDYLTYMDRVPQINFVLGIFRQLQRKEREP
jgi:protein-S-isoprenylcysteine O-methyltransferase Ste14